MTPRRSVHPESQVGPQQPAIEGFDEDSQLCALVHAINALQRPRGSRSKADVVDVQALLKCRKFRLQANKHRVDARPHTHKSAACWALRVYTEHPDHPHTRGIYHDQSAVLMTEDTFVDDDNQFLGELNGKLEWNMFHRIFYSPAQQDKSVTDEAHGYLDGELPTCIQMMNPQRDYTAISKKCGTPWHLDVLGGVNHSLRGYKVFVVVDCVESSTHDIFSIGEAGPASDLSAMWANLSRCSSFQWTVLAPGTSVEFGPHLKHCTWAVGDSVSHCQSHFSVLTGHLPLLPVTWAYILDRIPGDSLSVHQVNALRKVLLEQFRSLLDDTQHPIDRVELRDSILYANKMVATARTLDIALSQKAVTDFVDMFNEFVKAVGICQQFIETSGSAHQQQAGHTKERRDTRTKQKSVKRSRSSTSTAHAAHSQAVGKRQRVAPKERRLESDESENETCLSNSESPLDGCDLSDADPSEIVDCDRSEETKQLSTALAGHQLSNFSGDAPAGNSAAGGESATSNRDRDRTSAVATLCDLHQLIPSTAGNQLLSKLRRFLATAAISSTTDNGSRPPGSFCEPTLLNDLASDAPRLLGHNDLGSVQIDQIISATHVLFRVGRGLTRAMWQQEVREALWLFRLHTTFCKPGSGVFGRVVKEAVPWGMSKSLAFVTFGRLMHKYPKLQTIDWSSNPHPTSVLQLDIEEGNASPVITIPFFRNSAAILLEWLDQQSSLTSKTQDVVAAKWISTHAEAA